MKKKILTSADEESFFAATDKRDRESLNLHVHKVCIDISVLEIKASPLYYNNYCKFLGKYISLILFDIYIYFFLL